MVIAFQAKIRNDSKPALTIRLKVDLTLNLYQVTVVRKGNWFNLSTIRVVGSTIRYSLHQQRAWSNAGNNPLRLHPRHKQCRVGPN